MFARPGQRRDRCAVPIHRAKREWLLARLREADGPAYDGLCGEIAAAFPEPVHWLESARAVRAVRLLLWHGLAATEADESVWLTPAGWQAAQALLGQAGAAR